MPVVDFVHYFHTKEIVEVKPCPTVGHTARHVGIYGVNNTAIIKCNYCEEAVIATDTDDYLRFIDGQPATRACSRPFHEDENVYKEGKDNLCRRCNVVVKLVEHPSIGKGWYG